MSIDIITFGMPLRKGTVNVIASTDYSGITDDDGNKTNWKIKIEHVTWAFTDYPDLTLTEKEIEAVTSIAEEKFQQLMED